MLERAQEVLVELHRLRVAAGGLERLLGQPSALLDRVDELGVRDAELDAADDEVPRLGQPRVVAVRPGERAHRRREVAHEGGLQQRVLDELLVDLEHDLAGVPALLQRDAVRVGDRDELLERGRRGDLAADRLGDQLVQGGVAPGLLEVDLAAGAVRHHGAPDGARGVEHQVAGELGHGVVVAVGLVGLQLGELREVRGVDALVAEGLAELVHAVEAADDEPLEVELGGDAERDVEVEGVHVRGEGAGRGAAVHDLQHGRLDLDVRPVVERAAQAAHDGRALAGDAARVGVDDEVDVALADPGLRVGEAGVLVGQRAQRLARQLPRRREHRQLAALAADDLAGDADVVAQVGVGLPGGEPVGADAVEADHHLQLVVAVLQRGEAELAALAAEHHAAGHRDDLAGGVVDRQVGVGGADAGQRRRAGVAARVGRGPLGDEAVVLLAPDPDLLGHVLGLLGHVARLAAARAQPPSCPRCRSRPCPRSAWRPSVRPALCARPLTRVRPDPAPRQVPRAWLAVP